MMRRFVLPLSAIVSAVALSSLLFVAPANAAGKAKEPRHVHFHFEEPFGGYDVAAVQRGFQVYREVCSACHSMNHLHYRNIAEPGGPFHAVREMNKDGVEEIKLGAGHGKPVDPNENPWARAVSSEWDLIGNVYDYNGECAGEEPPAACRKGRPSDKFRPPYPNTDEARLANGGAMPPDLSVIVKARHHGAHYIYSLLSGYPEQDPVGLEVPPGKYYNPYFPGDLSAFWTGDPKQTPKGGFISMGPQLPADRVAYADGTVATTDQMAKDVAEFLAWASEPKLEIRRQVGLMVMIYLTILAGLLWFSYKQIWRNVEH